MLRDSRQIPADKRRTSPSPLILLKATKNAVEVEGMRNAHLKDAVALCDFISLLQEQVPLEFYFGFPSFLSSDWIGHVLLKVQEGKEQWDEMKVVHTLDEYRAQQDLNRGPSFSTIAAFGPNGAVIHYRPSVETNRVIDNSSFLLIDSGGQYLGASSSFGLLRPRWWIRFWYLTSFLFLICRRNDGCDSNVPFRTSHATAKGNLHSSLDGSHWSGHTGFPGLDWWHPNRCYSSSTPLSNRTGLPSRNRARNRLFPQRSRKYSLRPKM